MLLLIKLDLHSSSYPCDMVTVLHLVLYKTADLDFTTRERATHLLQILDKRLLTTEILSMKFFSEHNLAKPPEIYIHVHVINYTTM